MLSENGPFLLCAGEGGLRGNTDKGAEGLNHLTA